MSQKHTQLCHRSRLVQEILAATHDGHERVRLVRDTVSHLGVFLVSHFHLALVHHDALQIEEATLESNVGERALRFAHVTVVDDLLLLLLLLPVIHGRRLRLDRGLLRLPLHLLLPRLARGRVVLWVGQVVELRWIGLEDTIDCVWLTLSLRQVRSCSVPSTVMVVSAAEVDPQRSSTVVYSLRSKRGTGTLHFGTASEGHRPRGRSYAPSRQGAGP